MSELIYAILGSLAALSFRAFPNLRKLDYFLFCFIGVCGALAGGWMVFLLGYKDEESWVNTMLGAVIGAYLFLFLYLLIKSTFGRQRKQKS